MSLSFSTLIYFTVVVVFKGSSHCSQLTVFTSSDSGHMVLVAYPSQKLDSTEHVHPRHVFLDHHLDHFAMFLCGRYPMIPQLWITNRLMSDCWPPGWWIPFLSFDLGNPSVNGEMIDSRGQKKVIQCWTIQYIKIHVNKYTAMMSMQILHNLAIYDPS